MSFCDLDELDDIDIENRIFSQKSKQLSDNFNEIENYIYQELNVILSNSHLSNISEDKKNELVNSLSFILRKRRRNHLNLLESQYSQRERAISQPSFIPSINIIQFPIFPASNGYPNIPQYQSSTMPLFTPNTNCTSYSYCPNYSTAQMPIMYPNFFNFNQAFPLVPPIEENIKTKTSKKKSKDNKKKSKSKKADHKHKKEPKPKKSNQKHKKDSSKIKIFDHKSGHDLDGIINYLTSKAGGNVVDKGIINVTPSSTQSCDFPVMNVKNLCDYTDLGERSMWSPKNQNGATILFDFKTKKVKLTDYTLHTPNDDTRDYPRSWSVDCSNDLAEWDIVDDRKDESVMNDQNVSHTFNCQTKSKKFYRYLRITSKGPCWLSSSRYYFDLTAVEFFGSLIE